jgi:hypothetical protein
MEKEVWRGSGETMTDIIDNYANTLLAVVVVTAVSTLIAVAWYEIRQSRKRVEFYQGRQWNDDEGGAP